MNQKLILFGMIFVLAISFISFNQVSAIGGNIFETSGVNGNIQTTSDVTISGSASDPTDIITTASGVSSVDYILDGGGSTPATTFDDSTGIWSVVLTSLPDGPHTVEITDTPNDGSPSITLSVSFLVYTYVPPTPEFAIGHARTVLPPSFGGDEHCHYTDGLLLNNANYDISNYNNLVNMQILQDSNPITLDFKICDAYTIDAITHVGLYFIPTGKDMITPNNIASVEWDSNQTPTIKDGGLIKNVVATMLPGSPYQHMVFHFTPTKSFQTMSFLVRAVNDHRYSTDVRLYDDSPVIKPVITYPDGVVKYDSFEALYETLNNNGFEKPLLLSRIQGDIATNVNVYWLLNSNTNQLTQIIEDASGNVLSSSTENLHSKTMSSKTACDYSLFKNVCSADSIYGYSASNTSLTADKVQQLLDMGMWSGKIPYGMTVNTASH